MKRLMKMLILLSILFILGSCSTSKSINIENIKGKKQAVIFTHFNETLYPVKYIYISGGNYPSDPFFPGNQIEIDTGIPYTVTWTYEDKTDSNQWKTISKTNCQFEFSQYTLRIALGNSSSSFHPVQ